MNHAANHINGHHQLNVYSMEIIRAILFFDPEFLARAQRRRLAREWRNGRIYVSLLERWGDGVALVIKFLVRIRQPDHTGGAGLPVAHEKGRDLRLWCEFCRLVFPSRVRDACGPRGSSEYTQRGHVSGGVGQLQ